MGFWKEGREFGMSTWSIILWWLRYQLHRLRNRLARDWRKTKMAWSGSSFWWRMVVVTLIGLTFSFVMIFSRHPLAWFMAFVAWASLHRRAWATYRRELELERERLHQLRIMVDGMIKRDVQ